MNSLDGVWHKVRRAEEHLKALGKAISDFPRTNPPPYAVSIEPETESCYQFRLNIRCHPPLYLSVLAGDAVFNLRSALDHLAWQLSGCPTDERIGRRIEFPIFGERSDYLRGRGGAADKTQLMTLSAKGIVEALQPYHRRDWPDLELLLMLHEVNRLDKHRLLVPVYGEFMDRLGNLPVRHLGRLKDGDKVTVPKTMANGKEYRIAADVAFECPGIVGTINFDRLQAAYNFVCNTVVPSFEGLPELFMQ